MKDMLDKLNSIPVGYYRHVSKRFVHPTSYFLIVFLLFLISRVVNRASCTPNWLGGYTPRGVVIRIFITFPGDYVDRPIGWGSVVWLFSRWLWSRVPSHEFWILDSITREGSYKLSGYGFENGVELAGHLFLLLLEQGFKL